MRIAGATIQNANRRTSGYPNTTDDVNGELERISAELPPEQAAEFRTAVDVLSLNIAWTANGCDWGHLLDYIRSHKKS